MKLIITGDILPGLVVDLVTKTGRIDDSKRNASALLIELYEQRLAELLQQGIIWGHRGALRRRTDGDGLDLDAFLDVRNSRIVDLLVSKDLLAAERVHESCPAST